ncbi:MAG: hypothetical protein J2P36_31355, partial [Ktedonobacteraceae bacterium]|nr:hypothetical protein [Ktedonobacteraceae bacterium]
MSRTNRVVVTAQAEFAQAALEELQYLDHQLQQIETLAPGILLCQGTDVATLQDKAANRRPIFVRHLAPVEAVVDVSNTERDIGAIALALAELPGFALLERGTRFAVQSRIVQTGQGKVERPYSSGKLNQALAEACAEETGAVEWIKKPQMVISILCTPSQALLGISSAEENLSSWPGGARHFAQSEEQISRAEFKLLEALEVFGVELPSSGRAVDLGAAPGGWTRLLLEAGLHVVAVDPANLDPRLAGQKPLEHYRGYAERYLAECLRRSWRFDIITNDMRMDARDAARLLGKAAS